MLHTWPLRYVMKPRVSSIHTSNLLSHTLSSLPFPRLLLGPALTPGTNCASTAHCLALDLAVLVSILRISIGLGFNPAASVGIRIGFEIGQLATAVGATALDLIHKFRSAILRKTGCANRWHEFTWFM